jgi:hypothetical protein
MIMTHHRGAFCLAAVLLALAHPLAAGAQTDYYNLDAGRPMRVEDALVVERHAFELQLSSLRFSGARGAPVWPSIEPEIGYGILPRTQIEIGLPMVWERGGREHFGAAGLEIGILHALNTETTSWPALAIGAEAELPAGPSGPRSAVGHVALIGTRTMSRARVHLNAATGVGPADASPDHFIWRLGAGVDKTWPIQSFLLGADVVVERPTAGSAVRWSASGGVRRQLSPRAAVDLGAGRTLGENGEWFITFGSAITFGLLHRLGGVQ